MLKRLSIQTHLRENFLVKIYNILHKTDYSLKCLSLQNLFHWRGDSIMVMQVRLFFLPEVPKSWVQFPAPPEVTHSCPLDTYFSYFNEKRYRKIQTHTEREIERKGGDRVLGIEAGTSDTTLCYLPCCLLILLIRYKIL